MTLKASANGMRVEIKTTSQLESVDTVRSDFKRMESQFKEKGVHLKYSISTADKGIPHFRRLVVKSQNGNCSVWLDKGLDIFRFASLEKPEFTTQETYLVVESDK